MIWHWETRFAERPFLSAPRHFSFLCLYSYRLRAAFSGFWPPEDTAVQPDESPLLGSKSGVSGVVMFIRLFIYSLPRQANIKKRLWRWGAGPTLHLTKFWRITSQACSHAPMTHFAGETGKLLVALSSHSYSERWTKFPQKISALVWAHVGSFPGATACALSHAQKNCNTGPVKTEGICLATRHRSCLALALPSVALCPFPPSIHSDYVSAHTDHTCPYAHLIMQVQRPEWQSLNHTEFSEAP